MFLFPHPVKELADFLKSYDIHINYDAAHVAGLIAGGEVSRSVKRGSRYYDYEYTQNIVWSTRCGLVLAFEKNAEAIKKATFPGLTSSHHIHHMAAKAVTFAEASRIWKRLCRSNSKKCQSFGCGMLNDLRLQGVR